MPNLTLDHLVVASRSLEEGAHWLEARGVPTVPGGKHAQMATHNRLSGLGGSAYLELIAIDPHAPAPARPRWFGLDSPAMHERLASGPALIHWVARTDDIAQAAAALPDATVEILELSRGPFRWRIGVPADGSMPAEGALPTLIEWQGDVHPAAALAASGCQLESLTVRCRGADARLRQLRAIGLAQDAPVAYVEAESTGISASLVTPRGVVLLPEFGARLRS